MADPSPPPALLNRLLTRLMMAPGALYNSVQYRLGRWRRWDVISAHLIVGAFPRDVDLPTLRLQHGVTAVINLCEELPPHVHALSAERMTSHHMPLLDRRAPPTEVVERALALIEAERAAGGCTYVHCRAGKGRGPTVALCYLVRHGGLTPTEAEAHLRRLRPQVDEGLHRREVVRLMSE